MKEKIIISLLCGIVIMLSVVNAGMGPEGRNRKAINENRVKILEDNYVVMHDTTNDEYYFQTGNVEMQELADRITLYAISACMIDADTGRILYGKNPYEARAMASTTKILTCLLALENCSIDDVVTASEYAASMPDVQLNMRAGEQFRLYDLLLSLMLESHNDTAVAIAEHVGGSVEKFCDMMTKRAREIGCTKSVFLTPNGLDKEVATEEGTKKHSTTAEELALILRECLKNEQFIAICRTKNAMIYNVDKSKSYQLNNHNSLLNTMEGVIAGKTGFTCDAGYCYVGAVERDGARYICALLGCGWPNNKNYKWYDMNVLIDYAEDNCRKIELKQNLVNEKLLDDIPIYGAKLQNQPVYELSLQRIEQNTSKEILVKEGEKLKLLYEIPASLQAPLEEGEVVGKIHYTINGQTLITENLTVGKTIYKMELPDFFKMAGRYFLRNDYAFSSSESNSSEKCAS